MNTQGLNEDIKRSQIIGKEDPTFPGVDFLNVNMFVEAGAGAGKTRLIVERIVNQLKAGDDPSTFVVITFTNAAAEELRGRIANKVKEEKLDEALAHLDEMNISTIHSFCNVLLREQGILAGLPQNIALMDADTNKALQTKYFNEYMSKLSADDWEKIEKNAVGNINRWAIKNDIAELYYQIVDLPKDTIIITPRKISEAKKVLDKRVEIVRDICDKLFECAKSLINPDLKEKYSKLENFYNDDNLPSDRAKKFIQIIMDYENNPEQMADKALKILVDGSRGFYKKTKSYFPDKIEPANKEMHSYIKDKLGVLAELKLGNTYTSYDDLLGKEEHYRCLLEYAKKAKEYYYRNRPIGMVSNDNLLEITKDLICNEEDTRALEYFSKKYKHFYVDEFQDIDRIQEAFIYRLASDLEDPNHEKLRDGALFVVGDPKQSIYRFRGAQSKVYFDVKERMASESMKNTYVYELAQNFRSNNEVIIWVNEMFRRSDTTMPIINEYHPYQPMESVKEAYEDKTSGYTMPDGDLYEKEKLIHGVYKYEHCDSTRIGNKVSKNGSVNKDVRIYNDGLTTTEEDIEAVINLILNLKNEKYLITRYKECEDGTLEAYPDYITYKDFLLISQTTTKMDKYLKALKSYGIPVRIDGKVSFSEDKLLNTFIRLYWYLVNPRDPYHRMAAKESIRISGLVSDEKDLEEYTDSLLKYLYEGSKKMSAFGKAIYLENQISALCEKDRVYDVIEMYSTQSRLRQMIEMVLSDATGTGIQLAEAFEAYLEREIKHELSLEPNVNAIRLMNLHQAKGLEGNIVILLDRRGYKRQGIQSMKDENSFYPGIKKWSSVSGISMYEDKNRKEEDSEFHRLEYVAATRAKQAVIFMNIIKHGGLFATSNDKETEGYNYHIDDLRNSVKPIIDLKRNVKNTPISNGNYNLAEDGYGVDAAMIEGEALYEKVNPSKLEKRSATKRKYKAEKEKELEAVIVKGTSGKTELEIQKEIFDRPDGKILGNVLHRTMELVVDRYDKSLSEDSSIKKLTDFCSRQALKENEADIPFSDNPEDYLAYMGKVAYAYYKWIQDKKLLEDVKAVYTEMPFSYYTKETNEWVNGTADLIIAYDNGKVSLIDYKSDNDFLVDEATMNIGFKESYAPQLEVYKNIIQRMFQTTEDKIEVGVVSFSLKDEKGNRLPGEEIRVRYTGIE